MEHFKWHSVILAAIFLSEWKDNVMSGKKANVISF